MFALNRELLALSLANLLQQRGQPLDVLCVHHSPPITRYQCWGAGSKGPGVTGRGVEDDADRQALYDALLAALSRI